MRCPSCKTSVADDAWICPTCEHILDVSVLGEAPVVEAGAFDEHTRAVAWDARYESGPNPIPEAVILGDVPVARGAFEERHPRGSRGVLTGAGALPDGRTSTFLYYSASSPSRVVSPDAVPQPVLPFEMSALTPYEDAVLSLVDGRAPVRKIRQRAGLAVPEVVVTLLTLLDKGAVRIDGLAARPEESDVRPRVIPQDLDDEDEGDATMAIDGDALLVRRAPAEDDELADFEDDDADGTLALVGRDLGAGIPEASTAMEPLPLGGRDRGGATAMEPLPVGAGGAIPEGGGFDEEEATAMLDLASMSGLPAAPEEPPAAPERSPSDQVPDWVRASAAAMQEPTPPPAVPPARPRLPTAVGTELESAAEVDAEAFDVDFGSLLMSRADLERAIAVPQVEAREASPAPIAFAPEPPLLMPSDEDAAADEDAVSAVVMPLEAADENEVSAVVSSIGSEGGFQVQARPTSTAADRREALRRATAAAVPAEERRRGPAARNPAPKRRPPEPPAAAQPAPAPEPEEAPAAERNVDPHLASKAAKLFDQAVADRDAGNLVSARMNVKLALTFDPGNRQYANAFEEMSKEAGPQSYGNRPSAGQLKARELYDAATVAENEGDYDLAIEQLERALKMSPKQAAFQNRLGVILAMRKHEFVRAQKLIEEALEISPGNSTYERNLQKILSMAATYGMRNDKKPKRKFLGMFGRKS